MTNNSVSHIANTPNKYNKSEAFIERILNSVNKNVAEVLEPKRKLGENPKSSKQILKRESDPFLSYYTKLDLPKELLNEISHDLEYLSNIDSFVDTLKEKIPIQDEEFFSILKAFYVAKNAHKDQISMRPGDTTGTDFIPYLNHPIQVAHLALKAGLSTSAVKAALLHDVLEDTNYPKSTIEKHFDNQTLKYVDLLTQKQGETKKSYFDRLHGANEREINILKGLDRYHNLIRSFPIMDADYLERYAKETLQKFGNYFLKYPELAPFKDNFFSYLSAMKKRAEGLKTGDYSKYAA